MEITAARTEDIPELSNLLNILFDQEADFTSDYQAQCVGLEAIIGNPEAGRIFVALNEGVIVGMINLLYTISTALGGSVAILEDMIVAPEGRDLGVGSKLIEHGIQYAKEQGCKRITLLTDGDNEGAHRFYKRHGFEQSAMTVFHMALNSTG
ncbi:MAG: GNAT family N-acetyltransferase [Kordiimonadaceae bacterium]|nr:GNAT family N-acetyltransferase [Kordiimonadaceae bacterium]